MSKFKIVDMKIVYGVFVEYTSDGCSNHLVFEDISGNEKNIKNLISLLRKNNDVDVDSLNEIIEDFVCDTGTPASKKQPVNIQ